MLRATLLLALAGPALAQFDVVDTAWERTIASPSYPGLQPVEVEPTPDGGMLVLGLARDVPLDELFTRPADAVILKYSENGDLEWSDAVDSPPIASPGFTADRFVDAAVDAAGRAYVIVSRPDGSVLRAYGAMGTLAWEATLQVRTVPGTSNWTEYYAAHVAVHSNGDVIVLGVVDQGSYPRVDVRTFAPDGTLRWEWRGDGAVGASSTAQGFAHGLVVAANGDILIHGQSDGPLFAHVARVSALDADGTFLWRTDFGALSSSAESVTFDGQGDLLALTSTSYIDVYRVTPSGTSTSITGPYVEPGNSVYGNAIAVDDLDRIYVAGARLLAGASVLEPTLFRFAAAGAYLGSTIPSVHAAGKDGSLEKIHVTPRNDIVASGFSRSSNDEIIIVRIGPDGTERWALRRRGLVPVISGSSSVELGLGVDARGNLFTLAERIAGGAFPNQTLTLDLAKHVQNGTTSQTYCGPAVTNSTGAPAEIRALGSRRAIADNITLRVDHLPPSALTLLLASRDQGNVATVGGGQGTLCLGGEIGRFVGPGQVRVADGGGSASLQLDLPSLPQPTGSMSGMAGDTWNFQAWYRDANPGATSNLSNGVTVTLL